MSWLEDLTGSEEWANVLTAVLFVLIAVVSYAAVRLLFPLLRRAVGRSKFDWDDVLLDKKVQHRTALLAPAILAYVGARAGADQTAAWSQAWERATAAFLILVAAMTLSALLGAVNQVYERRPVARDRPIEAYVQLAQIAIFLFAGFAILGVLLARSPLLFVGGLGAMMAVLLLVFKDTILSFVASIQIVQSDLIDIGDQIEMPSFNADGYVTDLSLHTVTVENFDKSISFIPTHRFIADPFRNWKGMEELGRRRVKRAIHIDVATIRFLTEEEIDDLARFEPLADYIKEKRAELGDHEASREAPTGFTCDRRRLTNVGTLRAYLLRYLEDLETVDTDGTLFLVRQLEPGPHGLPIEIYAFAKDVAFAGYEAIQADIFDHILAMIPRFGLRVFQGPRTEPLLGEPRSTVGGVADLADAAIGEPQ